LKFPGKKTKFILNNKKTLLKKKSPKEKMKKGNFFIKKRMGRLIFFSWARVVPHHGTCNTMD
jgi:hypothetical protein